MATDAQIKMIRAKQRVVGGKLSSVKQLRPMSYSKIQEWVKLLDSGMNPYDHTEGQSAQLPIQ